MAITQKPQYFEKCKYDQNLKLPKIDKHRKNFLYFWKKDEILKKARLSDELEVSWYASPSEKLGGDGLVKKLERSASEIGASPSGRVFLPPNVPHVAVVSIAGQNYKKAEFFTPVKEDKRAPSAATIEDGERGVGGKWIAVENPFSGERVGANSISFWKFHQHSHQFTRIDSSSQEKLTWVCFYVFDASIINNNDHKFSKLPKFLKMVRTWKMAKTLKIARISKILKVSRISLNCQNFWKWSNFPKWQKDLKIGKTS